ncbi:MAG: acyltransferase [Deltaproteobacteria bacterium]|nr:acyltransferase [Deltaproteobacteria bacterium]
METALDIFHALARIAKHPAHYLVRYFRILKYRLLSNAKNVKGKGRIYQPVLFSGSGEIIIGKDVTFGVCSSPGFYSGYHHIEARSPNSLIVISDHCWINNNCTIISDGGGIRIGPHTLFGTDVEIYDSDFHELTPEKRIGGKPRVAPINIGQNVFIGSHVRIMKGVDIGDNSVIANSSVIVSSIPANVVAAGNPGRVIKSL